MDTTSFFVIWITSGLIASAIGLIKRIGLPTNTKDKIMAYVVIPLLGPISFFYMLFSKSRLEEENQ